jgi:hypothetical protein
MDDDVEKQTTDRDTELRIKRKRKELCIVWCISVPLSFLIAACITAAARYYTVNAQFSVAADSVSSLVPKAGLTFNLTLIIASRSHGAEACINPGMYVEVFYCRIRVAASEARTRRTCAGPLDVAEVPVEARAIALPVGQGQDSLSSEIREGVAVFDFVLHVPPRSYGGESATRARVALCKGSRVGGPAVLCDFPRQSI